MKNMISEHDCTKILNAGDVKYTAEEVNQIRDLLIALATIEYEYFLKRKSKTIVHENSKIYEPRKAA